MSLRLRVVFLIGLVLFASTSLGAVVAGLQVRHVLKAELAAGLGGARQTVLSAFEDLPHSDHPTRDLGQLVATFDGNRHVRAMWVAKGRGVILASQTEAAGPPPPRWFRDLLGAAPPAEVLDLPVTRAGAGALILAPLPDLDVQAAWSEFRALTGVLVAVAVVGLLLIHLAIAAAFRPLTLLAHEFERIGAGDHSGRVAETGPAELLQLQRGFNHMAGELATTTRRNRQLTEQLARLQDEERADIARDLHDEIGPHLFAVSLDAEMIVQLTEAGKTAAIPERVREIQGAVRHMQRQVRDLLGRLRPTRVTEFGLAAAIEDLVRFWSGRQPQIAFDVTLPPDDVAEATADVVYRIVQEGVNNAVRHGKPSMITVVVAQQDDELLVSVEDDGVPGNMAQAGSGLGLIGMRERVEAGGGSLRYGPDPGRSGWRIAARVRLPAAANEVSL